MNDLEAITRFFIRDTDVNAAHYEAVAEACSQRKANIAFFPVQWLRERLQEQGAEPSGHSVFSVRLVEALGSVIQLEPGGIRSGRGVPPPVQRRMAAQVRATDKPLSAIVLRRGLDGGWLRRSSPREHFEAGQTDPHEQLQALKYLLQTSQKKGNDLRRCASSS